MTSLKLECVDWFSVSGTGLDTIYTPPAIAGVTDPSTRVYHDDEHRVERIERPDGTQLGYEYTASGGRLSRITEPRGSTTLTYRTASVHGATRATGQVASITSPDTVTLALGYDGPMGTSQQWSGNATGTVERVLDIALRDSVERVNGSHAVTYGYDSDGLVTSATPSSGPALTLARRTNDGRVQTLTCGVVVTTHTYDALGELTDIAHTIGGTPYLSQHMERDSAGRVVRIDETKGGTTVVRLYGHDASGRLSSVSENGTVKRTYEYDSLSVGNGNRTRTLGPGGAVVATALADAQDRLVAYGDSAYTYTAAGELARRIVGGTDTTRYVYDLQGDLLQVTRGTSSIRYRVDGAGRRVGRIVNGVPEHGWLWSDGTRVAAELDGAGAVLNRYVYASRGHSPDLVVRAGTVHRVLTDHLGSVRALVDATSGTVVQSISYDAWGARTEDTAPGWQSLGYAGGLSDSATRLVRFGARDYDPVAGRWTSKDPIGFAGGDANLYAYVGNLPMDRVDPSGSVTSDDLEYIRGNRPKGGYTDFPLYERYEEIKAEVRRDAVALPPGRPRNDYEHQEAARRATIELGAVLPLTGGLVKEAEDTLHGQGLTDGLIDLDNNLRGIFAGLAEVPRCPRRPLKQGAGGRFK